MARFAIRSILSLLTAALTVSPARAATPLASFASEHHAYLWLLLAAGIITVSILFRSNDDS